MHNNDDPSGNNRLTGEEVALTLLGGLLDGLVVGFVRLAELARHKLGQCHDHQQHQGDERDRYRR